MRVIWPLTGRSEEMRIIEAAITAPDLSGIIVCGAAGVGKSRIAREALSHAASNGREARWAVGTSSAHALPLGALASWAGVAGTDNLEIIRAVIESLTASPPGTTVVVGVDDVHLLDDLSTFVLHQIVQRRAAKVVLTVRDGEPIPAGLQELWKDGQLDRLDLQPLSPGETATLLSSALGGSVDPQAARRLWKLTQGNALYLRNIVEQEVTDGRLTQQHGYWRWTGDPTVPPGLAELVESRIGSLPTPVGDVIDALAVGEPIELASLTRIANASAVEEAEARGLVMLDQVDGRAEVRLAHPIYGEVRRRRAPITRLRRLRGLVARELAASTDRDDLRIVVRRATLSLDSDLTPDGDLLIRAAQGAMRLVDLPLADRLAEAAIRAGAGPEANFVRSHALSWLGRGEEADSVLAAMPAGELTDGERARVAFYRATNRMFALADPTGAKRLIDDASHTTPPQARSCLDAFLTVYWAAMGEPEAARESSRNLVLDQLPDIAARLTAHAITRSSGDAGRTTAAVAAAEAGYDIPMPSFVATADDHLGALLLSGRVADAQEVAAVIRQRTSDFPSPQLDLGVAVAGRAALGAGRLDDACSLLGPAVELLTAWGEPSGWAYRYQLPHTIALAIRGLTDEAAATLDTLSNRRHPSWQYLDYELAIAHAWVAAGQGAITEAVTLLLSAAEIASANGQFAPEVLCLQTATQFGDRSTAARLNELESIVEGPRVGLAARFAVGMRDGDGTELAAVSKEYEQMGDLVAAVDAAAHAATAYRRQDLRGSALGCSTRAGALADQCGGARTPALRQATEPLPLTDREREIVMLLGEGLSSRDVAQRLTLSVRTVETHIYRAMTKTDTASREQLTALLPRPKPASQ